MSLKTKFFLLRAAVFLLFAALCIFSFNELLNGINLQWGEQFAERQVLFDKQRTLSPLVREIHLAQQMAKEPALIAMIKHENDPVLKATAFKMLEEYRFNFRDHSYFVALSQNGHYYFNDAEGHYTKTPYRYTLAPDNKNDRWFYATLEDKSDYRVNVDPDTALGVTKVWINVPIRDGDKTLGIVGTGIDLDGFLKGSVGIDQPGVDNFFIDSDMAIQLSTDPQLIDYASITKDVSERIKIDVLFSEPSDMEKLRRAAKKIENSGKISTFRVKYRGHKHLLGIAYLPEIGWYDLTLIDEKSTVLRHNFYWLPALFGGFLLIALIVLDTCLRRWVLNPIQQLKKATVAIQQGNYEMDHKIIGTGEIAELSASFHSMFEFIKRSNAELEHKVQERTEELQRLTEIDPLTGLLNRRGMMERFEREFARKARQSGSLGLLLLDLDHFKQINDTHGHSAGDLALCATANVLQSTKRPYDHAGRWGGEEFLILLPECSEQDLLTIAERIREAISALRIQTGIKTFTFTTSIGAHHSCTPQTLDAMLQQVDIALYSAKKKGRNCVQLSGGESAPDTSEILEFGSYLSL